MKAMVLLKSKQPLELCDIDVPSPAKGQVLIKVHACGVCRTDLHILDGDLTHPHLPLVMGHQIVGTIVKNGEGVTYFNVGERVGVPWLGGCCNHCDFCLAGRENLCDQAIYTGYQMNGGFAEYTVANEQFCFKIPEHYNDLQAAPLLCAGLIGYRAYKISGKNGKKLGLYGFGSAAHLIAQIAKAQNDEVYAFTRPGDIAAQNFAKSLGAVWTGSSNDTPPFPLDRIIIFASDGSLVPLALKAVKKGGRVVCAGIHMSDIPTMPYSILWEERELCSVANLTRLDSLEFFELISKFPLQTKVTQYPLAQLNEALQSLKNGQLIGSAVISL